MFARLGGSLFSILALAAGGVALSSCVTAPSERELRLRTTAQTPAPTATASSEPVARDIAPATNMGQANANGANGDHGMDGGDPDYMPIFEGVLGPHSRTISTNSYEAQQYFTQGMQLLYAFTPDDDAIKAFKMAQRHDPGVRDVLLR